MRTTAGLDWQASCLGDTSGARKLAADYIALSADATAPAAGDTTLTGEITTAGGGLIRAQGAYAHTGGASTYTISNTFTANGTDALPVTIKKVGVFNDPAAGDMPFEDTITDATMGADGDQLTVTVTVSM